MDQPSKSVSCSIYLEKVLHTFWGGGEGEGKQGGREGGGQKANQQVIFALQGRRELHCGYLRG